MDKYVDSIADNVRTELSIVICNWATRQKHSTDLSRVEQTNWQQLNLHPRIS